MDPIAVHPIEGSVWDSLSIEFSFRMRVLDAATGEVLQSAYAEKPKADKAILERRGAHPFRVLEPRRVQFTDGNADATQRLDVEYDVQNLRAFVKDDATSTKEKKSLKESWKVVPEFFQPHTDKERVASADGKTVFVHVDASTEQYVCIKDASKTYAERDLITDRDGLLHVPLPFLDWLQGTTYKFKFRDYVLLEAKGDLAPEKLIEKETKEGKSASINGHKAMKIALEGDPLTNGWTATVGTTKGTFVDEFSFTSSACSFEEIDVTVWAVRRVKRLSDIMPAADIANGSGTNSRTGIMIHFNSGYYMYEKRPDFDHKVLCRDAFTNRENRYMMNVKMAMGILKSLNGTNGSLGYNYHIEEDGTPLLAVDETLKISHAGYSKEASPVVATENVDTTPRTVSQTIASPKSGLNSSYIGIDVLGNNNAGYHYTAAQLWYLDRLIENIRSRVTTLPWYRIQGHDEVRAAYNATAATAQAAKADPGAALDGGMTKLRGRHGAVFP